MIEDVLYVAGIAAFLILDILFIVLTIAGVI
jgi:hypothetical protein